MIDSNIRVLDVEYTLEICSRTQTQLRNMKSVILDAMRANRARAHLGPNGPCMVPTATRSCTEGSSLQYVGPGLKWPEIMQERC